VAHHRPATLGCAECFTDGNLQTPAGQHVTDNPGGHHIVLSPDTGNNNVIGIIWQVDINHGLSDLLFPDGARRTDRCADTTTDTNDFIDAGYPFVRVPIKSGAFEDAGTQLVAAAILTEANIFIHRNIKPKRIFFKNIDGYGETPIITGFGPHRDVADEVLPRGMIVGTPKYMAPEQFRRQGELTPALDVYALGTLMFEALAGSSPYRRANVKAMVYLSDVTPDNGPFEYLCGTHRSRSVLRIADRCGIGYRDMRLTNAMAESVRRAGFQSTVFPGAAGTLLFFNARGIHRGVPIREGVRYAVTNYYQPRYLRSLPGVRAVHGRRQMTHHLNLPAFPGYDRDRRLSYR